MNSTPPPPLRKFLYLFYKDIIFKQKIEILAFRETAQAVKKMEYYWNDDQFFTSPS